MYNDNENKLFIQGLTGQLTGTTTSNLSSTLNVSLGNPNPSHKLFVGTSGSVAVGTSTPLVNLEVYSGNPAYLNFTNSTNTMTQTKVAVFKVERDLEKKTIIKSAFMEELWVERVSGVSLELLAAKDIKDFDPLTMVIKEVYSLSL